MARPTMTASAPAAIASETFPPWAPTPGARICFRPMMARSALTRSGRVAGAMIPVAFARFARRARSSACFAVYSTPPGWLISTTTHTSFPPAASTPCRTEALQRPTEKKVPSGGRPWRTLYVSQAEPDDAPAARRPMHQDEGLSRRRGRRWQDVPDPAVRPRRVRRPLHHDPRREGLEARDGLRGEGPHEDPHGHDRVGHHGGEGLPGPPQGTVLRWGESGRRCERAQRV